MKALKYFILALLALNHIYLIFQMTEYWQIAESRWYIVWITGITNYILTIIYAVNIRLKTIYIVGLGITGITWAFPPLLFTFFGIPFLVIYLTLNYPLLTKNYAR